MHDNVLPKAAVEANTLDTFVAMVSRSRFNYFNTTFLFFFSGGSPLESGRIINILIVATIIIWKRKNVSDRPSAKVAPVGCQLATMALNN